MDVRKNGTDVGSAFQDIDRVMGIASFHDCESSVFQHLSSTHPNEGFVLNNQNNCIFLHKIRALSFLLARDMGTCGTRRVDNA